MPIAIGILALLAMSALTVLPTEQIFIFFGFGVAQTIIASLLVSHPQLAQARTAILTYGIVLAVISLVCLRQSTSQTSPLEPNLMGSDGQGYFFDAMRLAKVNILENLGEIRSNYLGYQLALAFALSTFGTDLLVGLMLNNIVLLITVSLLAYTTLLATRDPNAAFWAAIAFMLMSRHVYYANALLKEPFLMLGVILTALSFVLLRSRSGESLKALAAVAVAALIFGTMRQPMLVLIPAMLMLLGTNLLRRGWVIMVAGFAGASTLAGLFAQFTTNEFTSESVGKVATENSILDAALEKGIDAGGVVGTIMAGYTAQPLPVRIITVPVPAALQFALPFDFWSTKFLDEHILALFNNNLNIVWYLFVGVWVLYALYAFKRLPDWTLKAMLLLGTAMFLLIAFTFGGVVPRYSSPYILLMLPAAGYFMSAAHRDKIVANESRTFFRIFYAGFALAGLAYLGFSISRPA